MQARRRLGVTATLVREDAREDDVFSLIGPKKYDVPWRELETKGWIASASCTEIRVALPDDKTRMEYAVADHRAKYRIASENPADIEEGLDVVRFLNTFKGADAAKQELTARIGAATSQKRRQRSSVPTASTKSPSEAVNVSYGTMLWCRFPSRTGGSPVAK